MVIRPATPDEAASISDLAMRSKAVWGYSPAFLEACRAELTWSAAELQAKGIGFFVAVEGADLLGFHAIEDLSGGEYELAALFVEPARIGTGVGRALIEHAKSEALSCGARVLMIQGDPHAERFYRAAGAERIGERPSESVTGRSLPLFAIRLTE